MQYRQLTEVAKFLILDLNTKIFSVAMCQKKVEKVSDSHKRNGNGLKGTRRTRNKMSVDEVFPLES